MQGGRKGAGGLQVKEPSLGSRFDTTLSFLALWSGLKHFSLALKLSPSFHFILFPSILHICSFNADRKNLKFEDKQSTVNLVYWLEGEVVKNLSHWTQCSLLCRRQFEFDF